MVFTTPARLTGNQQTMPTCLQRAEAVHKIRAIRGCASSMRRFDSASSELEHEGVSYSTGVHHKGSSLASSMQQAEDSSEQPWPDLFGSTHVFDAADSLGLSASHTEQPLPRGWDAPDHFTLHQRWDSAHSDTFRAAIFAPSDPTSLLERIQREEFLRCQEQPAGEQALMAQLQNQEASQQGCLHQQGELREADAMPAAASDIAEDPALPRQEMDGGCRRSAQPHVLPTEERVRHPRRSRHSHGKQQPPPRAKRCLAAAFAAAADERRLRLLQLDLSHSACSPVSGRTWCPNGAAAMQPHVTTDLGHVSSENSWKEGTLWEALQSAPHGVPNEAARAVVASVAYGLEHMHRDGLVHRNVSTKTVVLGELSCFDTARCGAPSNLELVHLTWLYKIQYLIPSVSATDAAVLNSCQIG